MAYFEIFRGTQAEVNAQAIVDGQILYTTDLGINDKIYKDVGSVRTILSNDNGISQSYTPIASNLGTITTHTAMVKSGIGRYKLTANSGTWTAGTTYLICILPEIYRPSVEVLKPVLLTTNSTLTGYMWVKTNGNVEIQPRTSMTNSVVFIDETYLI